MPSPRRRRDLDRGEAESSRHELTDVSARRGSHLGRHGSAGASTGPTSFGHVACNLAASVRGCLHARASHAVRPTHWHPMVDLHDLGSFGFNVLNLSNRVGIGRPTRSMNNETGIPATLGVGTGL